MASLILNAPNNRATIRDRGNSKILSLPLPKNVKQDTSKQLGDGAGYALLHFVGTATTIMEWEGIRLMTDPNFLQAGDRAHLGPGVTTTRRTNPSVAIEEVPPIDIVLLSHYHAYVKTQDKTVSSLIVELTLMQRSFRSESGSIATPRYTYCNDTSC